MMSLEIIKDYKNNNNNNYISRSNLPTDDVKQLQVPTFTSTVSFERKIIPKPPLNNKNDDQLKSDTIAMVVKWKQLHSATIKINFTILSSIIVMVIACMFYNCYEYVSFYLTTQKFCNSINYVFCFLMFCILF